MQTEEWAKVREARRDESGVDGITAKVVNDHYATISTDRHYRESTLNTETDSTRQVLLHYRERSFPHARPSPANSHRTKWNRPTVPVWFLRLGAPIFAAPIAQLFNRSITDGIVPIEWNMAIITTVPKVSKTITTMRFQALFNNFSAFTDI